MGRKHGCNVLSVQRTGRGHYVTKRRKHSINKANMARWRNSQTDLQLSATQSAATPLNAFRVMNLDELSSRLQQLTAHSAICGGSCTIEGETYRAGLACVTQAICSKCNETFSIASTPRVVSSEGKKLWTVNLGAVLGQMATGGGASPLQQVMASVGVPSMCKSTFISTERYIYYCNRNPGTTGEVHD